MSVIPTQPRLDVLQEKLLSDADRVVEQSKMLVRRRALMVWLTVCTAMVMLLVVLDYLLQREEFGLRILWFLSFIAVVLYAGWRTLRPAWGFDPTRQDVARWMESSRLSGGREAATAIQLASMDQQEERFGGIAFRQAALESWLQQDVQPAWDSLLDRSKSKRATRALFCLLGVVLLLVAVWPNAAWTGICRLCNPWLETAWPRVDRLEFRELPSAWALGAELQLEVVDAQPPLPENVQVLVRESGSKGELLASLPARNLGDIAIVTLPPLEGAVEVRAIGGDDQSMPWQRIEVIPVPKVEMHEFSIVSPEYSGLGGKRSNAKHVQALQGSSVGLQGRLSEPVASLSLRFRSTARKDSVKAQRSSSSGVSGRSSEKQPQVELSSDGRSFELLSESGESWLAMQSVSWRFEIETQDGLVAELPSLWGLDVQPDLPPEIRWENPDSRIVSHEASLDLAAQVTDDLGLVSVSMFASLPTETQAGYEADSGFGEDESRMLFSGDFWGTDRPTENKQIQVGTKWKIANYIDTEAVEDFEFWFRATDSLGQFTDSQRIKVRIKSKTEILDSIGLDAQQLAARIDQVLQSQRRNRKLTLRVNEFLQQSETVDSAARENLSSISQVQVVIRKQVGLGDGSLVDQVSRILADLERNQLTESRQADEMRLLRTQIQHIADTSLAQAQETAMRSNLLAVKETAEAGALVSRTEELLDAQASAIKELESILETLTAAEAAQGINRELLSIRDEQAALKATAEDLRLDEIENQTSERNKRQREVLSADQRGLARRVDELAQRIREESNEDMNPVADRVLQEQISELMRRAAQEFAQGDTSEATVVQEKSLRAIDRALGQFGFSKQQSNNFANRAQEWKELGTALRALSTQQDQLAKRIGSSGFGDLPGLSDEQQALRDKTLSQQDATEVGADPLLSQSLDDASESQKQAVESIGQNDASQASEAAKKAAASLLDASQAAEGKAREFEQQAQELELAQMAQVVKDLAGRQAMISEGLSDSAWDKASDLDDVARDRIRALAADQESIRQAVQKALDTISSQATLRWTLEQADKDMVRTVAAAQRFRVQPEARDSAKAALDKLELVAETLGQARSEPKQAKPRDPEQGEQESQEDSKRFPPLMTLKLMRGLQDAINQRTAEIHDWELSEAQKNPIIRELAERQQALAEQLEALLVELAEGEAE